MTKQKKFIPEQDMEAQGYGKYLPLLHRGPQFCSTSMFRW